MSIKYQLPTNIPTCLFFATLLFSSCASTQPAVLEPSGIDSTEFVQEPDLTTGGIEGTGTIDPGPYRAEYTKHHDLIHTKLEVAFDWQNQYLLGTATLELKPYFYPQSELVLDAKGFEIHSIQLLEGGNKKPLSYHYDNLELRITLDRTYTSKETYLVMIDYTAKPNEFDSGGSAAITSDKGLYFINPLGEDPQKPQQIWTQGETEANSRWFPTIDSPNQRTTQEIYITVEDRFTTLSNGQLVFSRGNSDGTRTDYWKMEQPHAPYLFMMAIGEFAIVEDQWKDVPVSYYVEPDYQQYASQIFGRTPQMMSYFSELLNYPYPWEKYAQVVVRDYVSGAMENTTASVFMEDLQVDSRFLIDDNWDGIIAHELFHHWFGDLVTSESWSNLTLNEAFATYAEYLWAEHLLGKDEADYLGHQEVNSYLQESEQKKVDLIRYYYQDKEDMFDSHSYSKGSRILHMLRNLLGDEAFFKTLNLYLTTYAGEPVEVHHLRLMAEKVSGMDLNWFFNQWFLDSGHPVLQVERKYQGDSLTVSLTQIQDLESAPIYRLPITLDFFISGKSQSKTIVLENQSQEFKFSMAQEPDLMVVDPANNLLADIKYFQSKEELIRQFKISSGGMTRYKAMKKLLEDSVDLQIVDTFKEALDDPFWVNRQLSVNVFEGYPGELSEPLISKLSAIAKSDPKSLVRADAITTLSSFPDDELYLPLYLEALSDSSYAVAGAGLTAYLQTEHHERNNVAQQFEAEHNIQLVLPLADYYALNEIPEKYSWYVKQVSNTGGELLYYLINYFGQYLVNADAEEQREGAEHLEDLGLNHNAYYIRFSAFSALSLLDGVEGVSDMKQRIREAETDPRLLEVYAQIP